LIETTNATAHNYEGLPGLIRKYYGIAPDGGSVAGIYLWESLVAANAFYTDDWVAISVGERHRGVMTGKHRWSWRAPSDDLLQPNSNWKLPTDRSVTVVQMVRWQKLSIFRVLRDATGSSLQILRGNLM
jgi:hypothetical protein